MRFGPRSKPFPYLAKRELLDLKPRLDTPPRFGYRVFSGAFWWTYLYWSWRQYLATYKVAGTAPAPKPTLGNPTSGGFFFTDLWSLIGIRTAAEYASRVGLPRAAIAECNEYGCVIVRFSVIARDVQSPRPYPGTQQGLTVGGAREWLLVNNVELAHGMEVTYIDSVDVHRNWFRFYL